MARKKVDPSVAKAKKQKKQAIVLSCLMLAVMAFSVPFSVKKFKALNAPPPAAAAAAVPAPAPAADGAAVPAATPVAAPVAGADAGAAAVASAAPAPSLAEQPAPEPVEGQLVEFGRFEAKDPFVQQVGGFKEPSTPSAVASAAPGVQPDVPSVAPVAPAGAGGSLVPGSPAAPAAPGTTPAAATPATPAAPVSASISVNGATAETVQKDGAFPTQEPIFKLVSITKKGAKIGVVGGNYATGEQTVDLTLGKKLTLMNTADGTRYVILLVSVA
jgi:hypothetical protein